MPRILLLRPSAGSWQRNATPCHTPCAHWLDSGQLYSEIPILAMVSRVRSCARKNSTPVSPGSGIRDTFPIAISPQLLSCIRSTTHSACRTCKLTFNSSLAGSIAAHNSRGALQVRVRDHLECACRAPLVSESDVLRWRAHDHGVCLVTGLNSTGMGTLNLALDARNSQCVPGGQLAKASSTTTTNSGASGSCPAYNSRVIHPWSRLPKWASLWH